MAGQRCQDGRAVQSCLTGVWATTHCWCWECTSPEGRTTQLPSLPGFWQQANQTRGGWRRNDDGDVVEGSPHQVTQGHSSHLCCLSSRNPQDFFRISVSKQLLYCIPCQGSNLLQKFSSILNPVDLRKQAAAIILGLRKKCGLILIGKLDEIVFFSGLSHYFYFYFKYAILGNFTYHDTRKNFYSLKSLCQAYFQILCLNTAKWQWHWYWCRVTCLAELCQLC